MTVDKIELIQGLNGMELEVESGNWLMLRDGGYSPVQSMVAAVGACGAYVFQSILESSRIDNTFKKVEISYVRDTGIKSEPIKSIEINFYLTVAEKNQDRAKRSMTLIGKHCPVMQSLDPNIEIIEVATFI